MSAATECPNCRKLQVTVESLQRRLGTFARRMASFKETISSLRQELAVAGRADNPMKRRRLAETTRQGACVIVFQPFSKRGQEMYGLVIRPQG